MTFKYSLENWDGLEDLVLRFYVENLRIWKQIWLGHSICWLLVLVGSPDSVKLACVWDVERESFGFGRGDSIDVFCWSSVLN